jgi:ABC-type lipoprotein export system ATPase subunit
VKTATGGVAVSAHGLTYDYRRRGEDDVRVLDGLDLTLRAGERLAVTGRSGAGKTTLLALLGGLERMQAGRLEVGDIDVSSLDGDALAAYRGSTVGFVFQHFGLLGTLTALENVELAMAVASLPRTERTERARSLLDAVGLSGRARHLPSALSGGESQRVAIARALANSPRLILADEPTGNLDDESTAIVLELLGSLADGHGCTLVVATHDDAVASRWDRRVSLEHGALVP